MGASIDGVDEVYGVDRGDGTHRQGSVSEVAPRGRPLQSAFPDKRDLPLCDPESCLEPP